VQLQTNALEEGGIGSGWIMVTATHTQKKRSTGGNTEPDKKMLQAQPSEEKKRRYTVKLFRTNNLKKGKCKSFPQSVLS
jgi:hypothetical protein